MDRFGRVLKVIVAGDEDLKFVYAFYENPLYNSLTRFENNKVTGFYRKY